MLKYLIWDVDGTLYPSSPEGKRIVESLYAKKVKEVLGIEFDKVKAWFEDRKKIYKSSTLTFLALGLGPLKNIADYFDKTFPEKISVKKDPSLIKTFEKLKKFEHYALRNGTLKGTFQILKKLGLDEIKWSGCEFGPFKKVWATLDTMGVPKPHPAVFEYVRSYLFFKEKGRFPKNEKEAKQFAKKILMIGDREEVDLKPAREMGMKTLHIKEFSLNRVL